MALKARLGATVTVTGFGVVTAFCVAAGVAVLAGAAGAAPGSITTVSTQSSSLGTILVSSAGRTLYHDSSEKKNLVLCVGACAKQWPPLLVAAGAKATAEPGAKASLLGTIKRPDGKIQVTYHGMPLYLFSGDKKAGDVKGQGVSGIWHVISPSGLVITTAAKTSTSSKGSGTSTTSSSSSSSSSSGSTSTGSGSGSTSTGTGSTGTGSGAGTTTTTPNDCDTNPGGYGCM